MTISDFVDLMPDTVAYKALLSRDAYGKPTYAAGVNYSARVVYKSKWIRRPDGTEVMAQGQVWLNGSPVISVEDQIVLPDSSTPVLLMVERFPDEGGAHHTKVYFG